MPMDILIRAAWAVGLVLFGWLAYRLVNRLVLKRAESRSHKSDWIHPGKPTLLYFTTPDCAPCQTTQRPAIRRLQERLGDSLEVIEVNAYEKQDLAREWGVLSVPTTFLLDSSGKPRMVNHGVASTEKLLNQVHAIDLHE